MEKFPAPTIANLWISLYVQVHDKIGVSSPLSARYSVKVFRLFHSITRGQPGKEAHFIFDHVPEIELGISFLTSLGI